MGIYITLFNIIHNENEILLEPITNQRNKIKLSNILCISLIDNKKFIWKDGKGGKIGHMTYILDETIWTCGNKSCIEKYIGKKSMIKMIKDNFDKFSFKYNNT